MKTGWVMSLRRWRMQPLCCARVDGGGTDVPQENWKLCLRSARIATAFTSRENGDGPLWQSIVPLCKEHAKPWEGPRTSRKDEVDACTCGILNWHVGVHGQLFGDCLDIVIYPFSWMWWGIFNSRPNTLYLGPLMIALRK